MVKPKGRLILAAGVGASVALTLWCYWVARAIPFDEARWKEPSWRWDRCRMVADLQAKLEEAKPSYDETTQMLDGAPEGTTPLRGRRAEDGSGGRILLYELGKPFPHIGRGNDRELVIGFDENGRVRGSEFREEDD